MVTDNTNSFTFEDYQKMINPPPKENQIMIIDYRSMLTNQQYAQDLHSLHRQPYRFDDLIKGLREGQRAPNKIKEKSSPSSSPELVNNDLW